MIGPNERDMGEPTAGPPLSGLHSWVVRSLGLDGDPRLAAVFTRGASAAVAFCAVVMVTGGILAVPVAWAWGLAVAAALVTIRGVAVVQTRRRRSPR